MKTIKKAFDSSFTDKEGAVLYFSALENGMNYFITRDEKDFKKHAEPKLPVISSQRLVALLKV